MNSTRSVVKTVCQHCPARCGILIGTEDGKITNVEGDPESPVNRGMICVKATAAPEFLYHPDRLKHPIKRVGERGSGKWKQISWDEALDTIAEKFATIRDDYGAESVFVAYGAVKGYQDSWLHRFANAFGTPNVTGAGFICHIPRINASVATQGFRPHPDLEYPSACVVVWGCNTIETHLNYHREVLEALDKGARLIVIDPRGTSLTGRADIWIQPRPSSDGALALSMANVIVNENLFDEAFVEKWTVGFDELRARVQDYSPERVEEITWVPAQQIREAARLYASTRPACIVWGNALEQNVNSFQAGRAISILRAITGNLCTPGGDVNWAPPPILLAPFSPELTLPELIETRDHRVSAGLNLLSWPPLPREIPPMAVISAIINDDPYPIRAGYLQGTNFLRTGANSQQTREALNNLEFLVVADLFVTSTGEMADIVLPVTSFLEYDSIAVTEGRVAQVQQKVAQPVGEARSDLRILTELAKRLGLGKYFWDNEEEALDAILKPSGMTFQEFRKIGILTGKKLYREYEAKGFATPSKKIELYSRRLEAAGFDPLPSYREPPETPYSAPELLKEYPLIFTSRKTVTFRHSDGRQIGSLRKLNPEPLISIHPETAAKQGIEEGDWVYIETKRGRIKQKATLATDIDPRVVYLDYGWWFPEKPAEELHGWAESDINVLTDNKPPYNREIGSTNMRGIICKVYKTSE